MPYESVTSPNPQSLSPNINFLCSTIFSTTVDVGTSSDVPRLPWVGPSLSRLEEKLSQLSPFRKKTHQTESPSLKKNQRFPHLPHFFFFFFCFSPFFYIFFFLLSIRANSIFLTFCHGRTHPQSALDSLSFINTLPFTRSAINHIHFLV